MSKSKNVYPKNIWFDDECKKLKCKVNNYPKTNDISIAENWNEYRRLEKEFKNVTQRKKIIYRCDQVAKFQDLLTENPNEYWKLWEKMKNDTSTSTNEELTLDDFGNYYRDQNNLLLQIILTHVS